MNAATLNRVKRLQKRGKTQMFAKGERQTGGLDKLEFTGGRLVEALVSREDGTVIEELDAAEIERFLRRQVVGRVGCHTDGRTYVVPVIYVWDGESVYVQSIEGRKIEMMRANPHVCFEVDEYEADGSWRSVIVEGVYEELEGDRAEQALARLVERFLTRRHTTEERPSARAHGRKPVAFRIRCTQATGRRVERTPATRILQRLGRTVSRRAARRVRRRSYQPKQEALAPRRVRKRRRPRIRG